MELTITLPLDQWQFILEVINLNENSAIKGVAINLLKPELDKQFIDKNIT